MTDKRVNVKLENITKLYINPKEGTTFKAVDDVSVEIKPGEFVTLLGPSGCGKTTTLRMIAGFESPDEGEIYIGEEAVNALTPNKRDTAMVFQNYALLPHYNVFNNVAYGLRLRKNSKEEIKAKVNTILSLVGLIGMEDRMTNQLSGGQQQRVALARALVIEPSVLLFDEPLSNLDAKLRVSMRTEIRNIQQEVGITAVYVTHDQGEAMAISDKIIIMHKGKIVQIGTPRDIYFRPKTHFVADFIGEANFLKGTIASVQENEVEVEVGSTKFTVQSSPMAVGDACELLLRPESVQLADEGLLPCKVTLSTFMGPFQYYQVLFDGQMVKVTEYNPKHKKEYFVGDKAFLDFKVEDLHLIRN
jgi:iron(III) transport system ATP-binding protein